MRGAMADYLDDETDEAPDSAKDRDFVEKVLRKFDSAYVPVQEERALNLQDRRFAVIAGAQWEGPWADMAENSVMVEINKTAQGVEKIEADYRANRMIVDFRGVGLGADEETADTLDGMFRADYYVSKGQLATDNAFQEAVQGGMGAWRLKNVYYDEHDPDDERQRVAFDMIGDADQSVFWDPNARLPDKSDAMWCVVITAMSKDAYHEEYGEESCTEFPKGLVKPFYDWFPPEVVRVAEYYEVELKAQKLHVMRHRATSEERREWAGDLAEGELEQLEQEGWRLLRSRNVKRRRVKKWVLSGAEVLEKGRHIAGTEIPIIMVYGKRSYIDNLERTRGHVRLAKDPQRVYNTQISKLTETAATSPVERPIVDPEQIAGYANDWAEANINRSPFLPLRALRNPDGTVAVAGPLGMLTPPQLPPVLAALIQQTGADIAELTSSDDGAAMTQSNVSADAMDIAAQRTDAKSAIYMDNMKSAWKRCGEVWMSMTRDNLVVEGDEVEIMSNDDSPSMDTAVIAERVTDDKGHRIRNDIARGKYHVIVDVTEATATQRDKTVKRCLNGAQIVGATDPELSTALTLTAFMNMDGEGIGDLKDWARQRALSIGLVKPTPEEQQAMEQEAANQPPDAQTNALQAQAEALQASAVKDAALADKAKADTQLSLAKVGQTEADAAKTRSEIGRGEQEHKVGMFERLKQGAGSFFSPKPNGGKPGGPEARQ